jgi:hypothetical protein
VASFDTDLQRFSALKTLDSELKNRALCPSCRRPIQGCEVRRYGRVTKKLFLDLVDRKYMSEMGRWKEQFVICTKE